mgnify:CR=1 FL=1
MIEQFGNIIYAMCLATMLLGVFGALTRRNLLKIIIALGAIDTGINLFIISLGYKSGGTAPILTGLPGVAAFVDPIPQALTLTSIVIGACVTALAAAIAIRIYGHAGTLNADEAGKKAGVSG